MSGIFLIFVAGLSWFVFSQSKKTAYLVCANEPIKVFCGTKNLSQEASEGKKLFNGNCAACHKMDANRTGPALRKTDSIVFGKWMYYMDTKIDTTKLEQLGLDYHRNLSKTTFNVSDLEKIYQYVKE